MRRFIGMLCLLPLGACASGMDAAECGTADWRAIGFEDGAAGATMGAFSERRKACAGHGITADFAAYQAGRAEGLALFCTPANGYRLGSQGYRYAGVCPTQLEGTFLAAHGDGYGLYQRRAALNAIGKRLQEKKARSQTVEHLIAEKTARLISAEIPVAEQASLAVEIKQLAEEKGTLYSTIHQLEVDHAEAEKAYRRYQARMARRPAT